MEIKDFGNIVLILALIAPGVIFLAVRSIVVSGLMPDVNKDTVGGIIVISAVYALAAWTFGWFPSALILRPSPAVDSSLFGPNIKESERLWLLAYVFAAPAIAGLGFGVMERKEWLFGFLKWIGAEPAHPQRTAWRLVFSRVREGTFLIVTFKDGREVAGIYGKLSGVGSENDATDIYIDSLYRKLPSGDYEKVEPPRGIWISGAEVSTVEFSGLPN